MTDEERREYRRLKAREWRAKNPGKTAEYYRRWRDKDPAKAKRLTAKAQKAWLERNPDKRREHVEKWRSKNVDKVKRYMRGYFAKKYYGVTEGQVEVQRLAQGNACAVCHMSFDDMPCAPHIDHDHATGKVRGLLCHRCNPGLGLFGDDTTLLAKAVEYLKAGGVWVEVPETTADVTNPPQPDRNRHDP